jgi:hypothetical protein
MDVRSEAYVQMPAPLFLPLVPAIHTRARKKDSTPPPAPGFHVPIQGPHRPDAASADRSRAALRFSRTLQHVQYPIYFWNI